MFEMMAEKRLRTEKSTSILLISTWIDRSLAEWLDGLIVLKVHPGQRPRLTAQ